MKRRFCRLTPHGHIPHKLLLAPRGGSAIHSRRDLYTLHRDVGFFLSFRGSFFAVWPSALQECALRAWRPPPFSPGKTVLKLNSPVGLVPRGRLAQDPQFPPRPARAPQPYISKSSRCTAAIILCLRPSALHPSCRRVPNVCPPLAEGGIRVHVHRIYLSGPCTLFLTPGPAPSPARSACSAPAKQS